MNTNTTTVTATTVIACSCKVCKRNGGPLSATVPTALLADLGDTAKTRHGLIYSAHDPSFVGRVTRQNLGIRAN